MTIHETSEVIRTVKDDVILLIFSAAIFRSFSRFSNTGTSLPSSLPLPCPPWRGSAARGTWRSFTVTNVSRPPRWDNGDWRPPPPLHRCAPDPLRPPPSISLLCPDFVAAPLCFRPCQFSLVWLTGPYSRHLPFVVNGGTNNRCRGLWEEQCSTQSRGAGAQT